MVIIFIHTLIQSSIAITICDYILTTHSVSHSLMIIIFIQILSYSFIHRHFIVQLAICYTFYLDKSKSIITHSLHIHLICLCIWTYQNQSFHQIALYIWQILITHKFTTFKSTSYIFATHSSRWARYLYKSKSIITHSLHTCHIGLCIWTNQNQSLHIRYTFVTHSPHRAWNWTNQNHS